MLVISASCVGREKRSGVVGCVTQLVCPVLLLSLVYVIHPHRIKTTTDTFFLDLPLPSRVVRLAAGSSEEIDEKTKVTSRSH